MKFLVLAAVVAAAYAAPQVTSSGSDVTITGKTIMFSEMVGSTNAVNREFTITKDNIQFSADAADTYTAMLNMMAQEKTRQSQLMSNLNTMKTAYDNLVKQYNMVQNKQTAIDTEMQAAIATAQANYQKLLDSNTNDLQPALNKVKTDVQSTSSTDTTKADAISTAMDSLVANGLFDTVETSAQTAFNTAKTTAQGVSTDAMTKMAALPARAAMIDANVTMYSTNFSMYGPMAVESIQASTKTALDLAAGYVSFINGELAYADSTLPMLTKYNTDFQKKNATITAAVKANTVAYNKQLDVFRPVIKTIYGGAITQKIAPGALLAYDYLGQQLAASGKTLISGMYGRGNSGAISVHNFNGKFNKEWDQLLAYPGTDTFSYFGYDAAIEGNVIVGGARNYDARTPAIKYSSGIAYVYTRPDANSPFTMLQNLTHPDPQQYDYFGSTVAIANNIIYVAAPAHENVTLTKVTNHGSIFVYAPSNGKYSLVATLTDKAPGSGDQLATLPSSMAAVGDIVAAGVMYGEGTGTGTNHGEVLVWQKGTGNTWTQLQKFTGSEVAAYDYFGNAVSMAQLSDGTTVMVVGAYLDDGNGTRTVSSSGAVYLYEMKKGAKNFTETQILRAVDAMSADYFGRDMVLSPDGMTLMVTADGVDDRSTSPIRYSIGATYVYSRNANGKYVQVEKRLPATDVPSYAYYGRGLAMTNDFTAIGSYGDKSVATYGGAIYASYSGGLL